MKIEFIKETKVNGSSFYYTKVDDRFINDSLSFKQEEAKVIYDNIVKNKGKINFEEVLESVEVAE
jgi:hypothetical protein